MKKLTLVIVALLLAGASEAIAGPYGRGRGGWGAGGVYARMFDANTIETVIGDVVKINKIKPMRGMSYGVELVLKTEKETLSIHLGPGWFIDNQDTKIAVKDHLEVKGSRVTIDGKPALLAATVKKGDAVLQLRDDAGFPMWAAWRGNPPATK